MVEELEVERGYRRAQVDYKPFGIDLSEQQSTVDRDRLLMGLRQFLDLTGPDAQEMLDVNWEALEQAPDEDLVNALAMLGPFEPREKQALLEAVSLTERAQTLITMMSMAALGHEDGSSGPRIKELKRCHTLPLIPNCWKFWFARLPKGRCAMMQTHRN